MTSLGVLSLAALLAAAGPVGGGVRRDSGWSFKPTDFKSVGGRFPQLKGADRLYRAARREPAALDGSALLLCRVSTNAPRRWDLLRGPDLRVSLVVDGRPAGVGWGPEDAGTAVISFPGARVPGGALLEVRVEDRDATGTDFIGAHTFRAPARGRLEHEGATFEMRCAGLAEKAWRPRFERAADTAARALRTLASASEPDLTEPGAGRPWQEIGAAQGAVEEMAAFAGWTEPQVLVGYSAVEEAIDRWPKRLATAVREAEKTATTKGEVARVDGAAVSLVDVRCGNKALKPWRPKRKGGGGRAGPIVGYLADTARCAFFLEVEAGKADLRLRAGHGGARELGDLVLYTSGGGATTLVPIDFMRGEGAEPADKVELDPGDRVTIVAVPAALVRRSQARIVAVTGRPGALFRVPR